MTKDTTENNLKKYLRTYYSFINLSFLIKHRLFWRFFTELLKTSYIILSDETLFSLV